MKSFTLCLPFAFSALLFAGTLAVSAAGGEAANVSRAIGDERREAEREARIRNLREKRDAAAPDSATSAEGAPQDVDDGETFLIAAVEFSTPSRVFSQDELHAFREMLPRGNVSVGALRRWLDAINRNYAARGLAVAQALAAIRGNALVVSLLEPEVDAVTVGGNATTREGFVKSQIGIEPGDLVNMDDFHARLLRFNATNDAAARIAFAPGSRYGTSSVEEILVEPPRFSAAIFTDNYGNYATGELRGGAYGVWRSVTGRRDTLCAGGVLSEGSKSLFASYDVPVPGLSGVHLLAGGDFSKTEIVNGELRDIDLTGKYYDAFLGVKVPLFVSETLISNLTLTATTKRGESLVSGERIQKSDTDTLCAEADLLWFFDGGHVYSKIGATQGFNISGNSDKYTYFELYAEAENELPGPLYDRVRFDGGWSADQDKIPSSESFQLGGIYSVRGYESSFLCGAKGFSASAELGCDLAKTPLSLRSLPTSRAFVFFDYGRVFDDARQGGSGLRRPIYSTGFGLRVAADRFWEADLTGAWLLSDHPYERAGEDTFKLLFSLKAKF